jgi:hypothetical protein
LGAAPVAEARRAPTRSRFTEGKRGTSIRLRVRRSPKLQQDETRNDARETVATSGAAAATEPAAAAADEPFPVAVEEEVIVEQAETNRAPALNIEVKGKRRGFIFWRRKGRITLEDKKLFVDGKPAPMEPGKSLKVAGRRFQIEFFDGERGSLKLKRPKRAEKIILDQFGFEQAEQLRIAAKTLEAKAPRLDLWAQVHKLSERARILENNARQGIGTPTLTFQEPTRRVWYAPGIIRRQWNRLPFLNRLSFASHNPIRRVMGGRFRTGLSALVRRTFFGGQTPEGIVADLSNWISWKDLGEIYTDKASLGRSEEPGVIELRYPNGTLIVDRPALGQHYIPTAHGRLGRLILGWAEGHERLIAVSRTLKRGDRSWMRLHVGWFWKKTWIGLSEGNAK